MFSSEETNTTLAYIFKPEHVRISVYIIIILLAEMPGVAGDSIKSDHRGLVLIKRNKFINVNYKNIENRNSFVAYIFRRVLNSYYPKFGFHCSCHSDPRAPLYSLRTDPKENATSLAFTGRCLATGNVFDYY
jgi:hypothetical protein